MATQGFHAVIVAGGSGERLGFPVPKAYVPLVGIPLLTRTAGVFYNHPDCLSITVVIGAGHDEFAVDALRGFEAEKVRTVYGGATRQQSVKQGLDALAHLPDDSVILIHDAARPFVTPDIISNAVDVALRCGASSVAVPVVDTLRRIYPVGDADTIDRERVYSIQTPQVFRAHILRRAHAQPIESTDDAGLVQELGHKVEPVLGSRTNIKITTKDDLDFAAMILNSNLRSKIKTGLGYDVHAFEPSPDGIIRLGGVDIPHDKKMKGHSDADVVLHAITDALYGSISDGDIGFHFPPSKADHKNQDSADFLRHAVARVFAKGGVIHHIDCVIICEEPKITPHRDSMRARIAEICNLNIDDVSVKATTSEQLGFTGRREGIACQAIATIEVKAT